MVDNKELGDLGEKAIISNIIGKYFQSISDTDTHSLDDCALISLPHNSDETLLWTVDPCPEPVISILGDDDLFHYGRLSAVISLSDLAAMGAKPRGFLLSVEAPERTKVSDFERFLQGFKEALDEEDCPLLGGNIKDADRFRATTTAIGSQKTQQILKRHGAQPGNYLVSFGNSGHFFAAVLSSVKKIKLPQRVDDVIRKSLTSPQAKCTVSQLVAEKGLATAAVDASDGLLEALATLASTNALDVCVDPTSFLPDQDLESACKVLQIDPRKLMMSWGNWEFVCACEPESLPLLRQVAHATQTHIVEIGTLKKGSGRVWFGNPSNNQEIVGFGSVRFSRSSYFSHGIHGVLQDLETRSFTTDSQSGVKNGHKR